MKVLVNSSPLIFLAKLNKLDLLNELFDDILTTNEVLEEVLEGFEEKHQDALLIKKKIDMKEIQILNISKRLKFDNLGRGERSVLEAAVEHKIDTIIMDDLAGIKTAKYFRLNIISTPFVLLRALIYEKLEKEDFLDSFNKMIENFDYRISPVLYKKILDSVE